MKKYVSQREASDYFGRSERTLYSMRKEGLLSEGICWVRKIPNNMNSHVLYNLDVCEEVLNGLHRANQMERDLIIREKEFANE